MADFNFDNGDSHPASQSNREESSTNRCNRKAPIPAGIIAIGIGMLFTVILVILIISLTGRTASTDGGVFGSGRALTAEERSAWERARGQWDKKSKYVYCLVGIKDPRWESASSGEQVMSLSAKGWQSVCSHTSALIGQEFSGGWFVQASGKSNPALTPEEAAETLAAKPEIQVAVIVDLFSKPDPFASAWYRFEGGHVKKIADAPSASIRDSFAKHMLEVQHGTGR